MLIGSAFAPTIMSWRFDVVMDVVFAVRVGVFHREPERARALVEPWLRPNASGPTLFELPTR
jgi:hypothetical protein